MSRRSFAGALALVAVLIVSLGAGVAAMLRYEPGHHRDAERPAGNERLAQSQAFTKEFSNMVGEATLATQINKHDSWAEQFTFTDDQINSFLSEGFVQQGLSEKVLPEGMTEPRVAFEPDVIRLSFRYKAKLLDTVVSISLRPWVAPSEGNVLALRLEGIHAGAVPFKAQWLLERLSEVARQNDVEVSWYRHEGKPVAILRFQPNQPRPAIKLRDVRIEQGKLTVSGESGEKRRTAMIVTPGE